LPFCDPLALDLQHGLQGFDLSGSSSFCVTFCSHGGESISQVREISSEGISCRCELTGCPVRPVALTLEVSPL
jgi:hypothetical protein